METRVVRAVVLVAGLAGAAAALLLGQYVILAFGLGVWGVALLALFVGLDQAALAASLLAALGLLVNSGVRFNAQGLPAGVDPLGLVFALGVMALGVGGLLWRISVFGLAMLGGGRRESFRYLLKWLVGSASSYLVTADGKVNEVFERPAQSQAGQRTLLVTAGHVVVVNRANQGLMVLDPGFYFLSPRETVFKVLVTNPQSVKGELNDVMTKDGIPLRVEYSVAFRIASPPTPSPNEVRQKRGPGGEDDPCLKAAINTFDWVSDTASAAVTLLRDKIASQRFDDLFEPETPNTNPLVTIREELRGELETRASRWGMAIIAFNLTKLEMPERIREQLVTRWRIGWDAQLRLDLSRSALKIIEEHTGQANPEMALRLLETVLGGKNLEALSFVDRSGSKQELQELQAFITGELAKLEPPPPPKPPARGIIGAIAAKTQKP